MTQEEKESELRVKKYEKTPWEPCDYITRAT